MRLKIATTGLFLFGLAMLVAWPWLIGGPPGKTTPRAEQAAYALRSGFYVIVLVLVFFVTTVLAWMVARRARDDYRKETMENLKDLLEGTLRDHERKQR